MQTIKLKAWGMRFSVYIVLIFLLGGCAPIFDHHYFFSDTKGVVLMSGEPVSGVKVSRWYKSNWYLNDTLETVVTDDKGFFHFPHARTYSFFVFIHQPVVHQEIKFEYLGQQYLGWKHTRMDYAQDAETGLALKLECDLVTKEKSHQINSYKSYDGLCEISRQ